MMRCFPDYAQASVATITTFIMTFIAAKMTPYGSIFGEAAHRLFDGADLTTAITTATCLLSIDIIFGLSLDVLRPEPHRIRQRRGKRVAAPHQP